MSVTVLLCPALNPNADDGPRRELAGTLAGWGIPVVVPHRQRRASTSTEDEKLAMASWVADQAVAITAAHTEGPLLVVCSGAANRGVPALGFSQRAARRPVVAYVLLDGPLPDPSRAGTDWPDAPVVYVSSSPESDEAIRAAQLRGWRTLSADPISAVTEIARGWPDSIA